MDSHVASYSYIAIHYACTEIRIKCFDITATYTYAIHKATKECNSHTMLHGACFNAHS